MFNSAGKIDPTERPTSHDRVLGNGFGTPNFAAFGHSGQSILYAAPYSGKPCQSNKGMRVPGPEKLNLQSRSARLI